MTDEQHAEMLAHLAANETEHKSFRRRLDEHTEAIKKYGEILIVIERQSNAIERMGRALDRMDKSIESVGDRVAVLEKEPGEKWRNVTWEIMKYIVLALIGVAVGWIVKGSP